VPIHAKMTQQVFYHCYLDHYVVNENVLGQVILMAQGS